jgi:hypothetical protein
MNFRISQPRPLSRWLKNVAAPLGLAAALMLPHSTPVQAQAESFSFVALGDSRPMMYLPYTEADEDKVHAALVNIFSLILGE